MRKTDQLRIARAVGATIVNRPEDLKESDIGVGCGLFHVEKIADEYFIFLEVGVLNVVLIDDVEMQGAACMFHHPPRGVQGHFE